MTEDPNRKEGEFDETTSYSFLYFLVAGATLFVTLWAFWDDEYTRRGYKEFQDVFNKEQYARAESEYKTVNDNIRKTRVRGVLKHTRGEAVIGCLESHVVAAGNATLTQMKYIAVLVTVRAGR